MSAHKILQKIAATKTASRPPLYRDLLERLKVLARQSLRGAPPEEWEDTVQRVAIKLWTMIEDGTYTTIKGEGCIRTMVVNDFRSHIRRAQRRRRTRDALITANSVRGTKIQTDNLSIEEHAKQIAKDLERLVSHTMSNRRSDYREKFMRDYGQLVALAAGSTTMVQLLEKEGLTPESGESERKTVRNRVLKRHSRVRKDLNDSVDRLLTTNEITMEEAGEYRRILSVLLRCQRSQPGDVQEAESEER